MKKLLTTILLALIPSFSFADPSISGPHVVMMTDGTLSTGEANIVTNNAGPIQFFTNKTKRGYIDGTTGALTGFSMSAPNLLNNSYLTATNAAGSGTINILKVDALDDLILNSDASDVIKLQLESDANRLFTFGGASDTALTLSFGDGGITAAQQFTISGSTSDADDDSTLCITAGGACGSEGRGGWIQITGRDTSNGYIQVGSADSASSLILFDIKNASANLRVRDSGFGTLLNISGTGALGLTPVTTANVFGGSSMPSQVSTSAGSASALTLIRPSGSAHLVGFEYGNDASGVVARFLKTRSATATGSGVVQSGDTLGNIIFGGDDGDSISNAAAIKVTVDGVPGDSDMPGAIDFQVSPDGSGTVASVLKLGQDKTAQFTGFVRSSATSDLGWSVVNAANQACNTTCTSACVFGMNTGALGNLLACTDATADTCVCAGAS